MDSRKCTKEMKLSPAMVKKLLSTLVAELLSTYSATKCFVDWLNGLIWSSIQNLFKTDFEHISVCNSKSESPDSLLSPKSYASVSSPSLQERKLSFCKDILSGISAYSWIMLQCSQNAIHKKGNHSRAPVNFQL